MFMRKMIFKKYLLVFLPVVIVALYVRSVSAQNSVSITKMNDLTFGALVAGSSVTIFPTDSHAAMFQISYTKSDYNKNHDQEDNEHGYHYGWKDITLQFNLPNQLMNDSHGVPITFSNNSALWSGSSNINGAKSFDPNQQKELKIMKGKNIYIWLGGTVATSLSSWSGKYSSMITITINTVDN